ncbi:unnamed protein product, partial [Cuscuta europaea]
MNTIQLSSYSFNVILMVILPS